MVHQAHGENTAEIIAAQGHIIDRYSGAVYRYPLAALRDRDAADEVFQEFALRLVKGGFRNSDQRRGRFRDYVKFDGERFTIPLAEAVLWLTPSNVQDPSPNERRRESESSPSETTRYGMR